MAAATGAYRRPAASKNERDIVPADMNIPDNYVQHTLETTKPLPPVTLQNWWKELNYLNCALVGVTPLIALYGAFTTKLQWQTALFSVFWYFVTGLGITAGYHRLWAHRSYNASKPLEYFLAMAGAGAVQGSIKWWSRGHRAHHRYTDTDLDPYGAHHGLIWSHIGWMVFKPRRKPGVADVSDLSRNEIVRWQHRWYLWLILGVAFGIPTIVPGLCWGDWRGGYFYAGAARLCFVHHSTFCVNSLAHWLGETPFDDKHTPRDHLITALVTIGEGYHNFHHQFPMDYRNAIKWYQYDPTKWFITAMSWFGLASHLKVFPDNEVQKGQMTMELKKIKARSESLEWPKSSNDLPVISWAEFQSLAKERNLVLISGFIHDVSSFMEEHPGGKHLLSKNIGKDATTAFFGGVYDHSNAAHNLLAMMRVGVLHGGLELESEKAVPPSQKLRVVSHAELSSLTGSKSTSGREAGAEPRPESPPLSDFGSDHGLASSPSSGAEDEDMPHTPTAELSFELPSTSKA
ncbi:delta 9-fatty acid desaturase protein [Ceratobasidium sp. AG-I]|nr:delta 9-fatty acid desaturase protein [Ceratobasidium sp. AG-I]